MAEVPEPTPEELLAQIRQLKVSDLLLSTLSTVAQLGYAKLDPEEQDLEQARLAIESLRALLPLLSGSIAPELARDFNQVLANLQLAYADAAAPGATTAVRERGPGEGGATAPVRESGPVEGVPGEAAKPPVHDSGPGEGAPGEPGGCPAPEAAAGGEQDSPPEPGTSGEEEPDPSDAES